MSFVLYPYQQEFVNNIRTALFANQSIIAALPTGGGKTKCFIEITKMGVSKDRVVLIISESKKIYYQIKNEIGNCQHIAEGVKNDSIDTSAKVFVAMAQTLAKRDVLKYFSSLGKRLIVINDEAHIGTATNTLKKLNQSYIIGFTATPHFKFAKHLPEIYNGIVVGCSVQELIEQGFLTPYRHYARLSADLKKLKKGANGDFTEESQKVAFDKIEVYKELITDLNSFSFKKCMVFCSSIEHCEITSERLRNEGFKISTVHSKNPNADIEFNSFIKGDSEICVSVGSLTKGFDFPMVDMIVIYRAINSVPLYLQIIGRGSRIFDNKKSFIVLDYGDNARRNGGLWNADRDWEKLWNSAPKKESDVELIAMCKQCYFINPAGAQFCEACGAELKKEKKKKDIEYSERELIELTESFNSIRGKRLSQLDEAELAIYVNMTKNKFLGMRIARSKGDFFLAKYAKIMGYKRGFLYYQQADVSLKYFDSVVK